MPYRAGAYVDRPLLSCERSVARVVDSMTPGRAPSISEQGSAVPGIRALSFSPPVSSPRMRLAMSYLAASHALHWGLIAERAQAGKPKTRKGVHVQFARFAPKTSRGSMRRLHGAFCRRAMTRRPLPTMRRGPAPAILCRSKSRYRDRSRHPLCRVRRRAAWRRLQDIRAPMRCDLLHELGPGYRLAVEDEPAKADIEVLPHGLEAFNERRWPRHPRWLRFGGFCAERGRRRGGLAGDLLRMALHKILVGLRRPARPWRPAAS